MEKIVSNIHWLIFLLTAFQCFTVYEEQNEKLVNLQNSIPAIQGQLAKEKREFKQIKSYFKDIEEAKKNIELVAIEVEKLQKKLPSQVDDTVNLSLFRQVSEKLNMKSVNLQPSIENNRGFYFAKEYVLKAQATYLQFLRFMEDVGNNEKLINITEVKFGKLQKKQRGRFQLIDGEVKIEAYRYNPSHKVDRGFSNIEAEFENKKKKKPRKKRKKRPKK
ncbi:type 4a pilus biogenesis protein PilO [Bacteriovoracaceae bacterium]|nr:type 4a pilus biogenesis protein PilO [Bacteriovoracaceae bacterium]|tara:strand:+ start:239639 stop:240295 length:657 start_codon:yes stop_codon:yes gene_type:complete